MLSNSFYFGSDSEDEKKSSAAVKQAGMDKKTDTQSVEIDSEKYDTSAAADASRDILVSSGGLICSALMRDRKKSTKSASFKLPPKIDIDPRGGEIIGNGEFSTVYLGSSRKFGKIAIKVFNLFAHKHEDLEDLIESETEILSLLPKHQNLVSFYGIGANSHELIFEKLGITLEHYLLYEGRRRYVLPPPSLDKKEQLQIALDAAKGLEALHDKDIVHGDFKPANLLLGDDGHWKITDFGFAWQISKKPSKVSGTPYYSSPAVLNCINEGFKDDIYSFANTMYVVVTRTEPSIYDEPKMLGFKSLVNLKHEEDKTKLRHLVVDMHGRPYLSPKQQSQVQPKILNIIKSCWQDSTDRPTATDITRDLTTATAEFKP